MILYNSRFLIWTLESESHCPLRKTKFLNALTHCPCISWGWLQNTSGSEAVVMIEIRMKSLWTRKNHRLHLKTMLKPLELKRRLHKSDDFWGLRWRKLWTRQSHWHNGATSKRMSTLAQTKIFWDRILYWKWKRPIVIKVHIQPGFHFFLHSMTFMYI